MKKPLIDSIAKQNTVAAKVFTCSFFFVWENSSTVSQMIYPQMKKTKEPKEPKKPINRLNVFLIFKDLIGSGYLDVRKMKKNL